MNSVNLQVESNNLKNANIANITSDGKMMSSREIAQLTEKEHKSILRDIRRMLEDLADEKDGNKSVPISDEAPAVQGFKESVYLDAYGREKPEILLNFELTMTLVAGYNVKLRNRIIKRWQELETAAQQQSPSYEETIKQHFNIPQDYSAALLECSRLESERQRLASEVHQQSQIILLQEKSIQQKQQLIVEQKPQIDALKCITASKGDLRFRQVAKILNINENLLRDWLIANKWTYFLNGQQVPSAAVIKKHWLKLKMVETRTADGFKKTHSSMFFSPSGLVSLTLRLINENLVDITEEQLLHAFQSVVGETITL